MALCWPIKAAIRGYSETEAANLTASERRERTTKRVGLVAKAVYICIQLLCLTILLQSDSTLGHNWRSSPAIYAWSFIASTCFSFVLYVALCTSNPGYLPLPTDGEESVALNSKAHSEQAHLDHDTGLDTPVRVQPLPYPTNHANYINLAALGRCPATETRLEVPWWNLPCPGQCIILSQQQGHQLANLGSQVILFSSVRSHAYDTKALANLVCVYHSLLRCWLMHRAKYVFHVRCFGIETAEQGWLACRQMV